MSPEFWPQWIEQMSTGLAVLDSQLCLRWLNSALAEMLEVGPRSVRGLPLAAIVGDQELLRQVERAQRESRSLQLWGATLPVASGGWRAADISIQGRADGHVYLEVHLLHDASRAATPLSATLRGFAHEVKNPLAGLRGAAQLLSRRVHDESLQELAELVIVEADRLAALANRLLHHEDGAARLDRVNVHRILERLRGLIGAQAPELAIGHDFDPSLPDILGDADRLLQLLLNLARNAVKAQARRLTLRTRMEHGPRTGEYHLRGSVRVDVIDDGVGVPDALRQSLFEPWVSGHHEGTGLGLALCREIAHEHGGELRYRSRPGDTVFSLYLPRAESHDPAAAESFA